MCILTGIQETKEWQQQQRPYLRRRRSVFLSFSEEPNNFCIFFRRSNFAWASKNVGSADLPTSLLKPTTLTMYFCHILCWKENQGRYSIALSDRSFYVQVTSENGVLPVFTSSKELKVVFVLGMFYAPLVHACVYTQEEDSCYPVSE